SWQRRQTMTFCSASIRHDAVLRSGSANGARRPQLLLREIPKAGRQTEWARRNENGKPRTGWTGYSRCREHGTSDGLHLIGGRSLYRMIQVAGNPRPVSGVPPFAGPLLRRADGRRRRSVLNVRRSATASLVKGHEWGRLLKRHASVRSSGAHSK